MQRLRLWLTISLGGLIAAAGLIALRPHFEAAGVVKPAVRGGSPGSPEGTFIMSTNPLVAQDYGAAPELSNTVWLNTDKALRLADLRGKVVLLEFWTFECVNCKNTLPAIKAFHSNYKDQGLVVIGDHFPEFSHERDVDNVRQAVKDFGILYPVAIDNDGATWNAYNQRYWP